MHRFAALACLVVAFIAGTHTAKLKFSMSKNAPLHSDIDAVFNTRMRRSISSGGTTGGAGNSILKPTKLTSSEQAECLVKHNTYRSAENAANALQLATGTKLTPLTWNTTLADLSQTWAEECVWKHGMLYDSDNSRVGQNMFMSGGGSVYPSLNVDYAIEQWYVEKKYYHYDDKSCDSNEMCGHYTQLVWAKSAEIGCGYATCPKVDVGGNIWTNVIIFVCDYSPAGNVQGQQIYEKGNPCSDCKSSIGVTNLEGYKCQSNLCVPCLPRHDASCECGNEISASDCKNGAEYSDLDCVCKCTSGFYGTFCDKSCQCADLYDDVCPQWKDYCSDSSYLDFMKANCPVTCGLCDTPDSCNDV